MSALLSLGFLLLAPPSASSTPSPAPTALAPAVKFEQVFPTKDSEKRASAVVLIHGLSPMQFKNTSTAQPKFQDWQKPGSDLVQTLGEDSDVFSFSYGQDVPSSAISSHPELLSAIGALRDEGYAAIALVGHSAGGVIAREFVEDHPDSGVTKVVQVCSPNRGSKLGRAEQMGWKSHQAFIGSLSDQSRATRLGERAEKRIPDGIEFVCIVGDGGGLGDFVVADDSQWPEDLRLQGIPAVQVIAAHFTAMRSDKVANEIARLVREPQARWNEAQVEAGRRDILESWVERERRRLAR